MMKANIFRAAGSFALWRPVVTLAAILLIWGAPTGSVLAAGGPTYHPPNVFPLMAWDDLPDAKTAAAMRDCGITCVAFVRPDMLNVCRDHGLLAVVFDESVAGTNWSRPYDGEAARRHLPALVDRVGKHPAVMGYHLKDEPGAHEFSELAKAVAAVKELAPGKWPYINLLPGDGADYLRYVEGFINTCKPTIISYDRYVLAGDNDFSDVFWSNLAAVRDVSRKHGLPYWNIVLTAPHWSYRELTEVDVRLQNWGSLAYGVSGLAFYKFCSKELSMLDAPDLGNFRNGPLDQFGEKTLTWHWLRNCNRQIQNLAPTYMKLRSDSVYHFGKVPVGNQASAGTNLVKAVNGEAVVGDFTHADGSRYVLIVNKSLKTSMNCQPEFYAKPSAVKFVSPRTGEHKPYPLPYYWLAPGQGVLLQVL
ncbi:MAG TPA: hypothetical protein P5205_03290 [Candidatus Paceibacterota bacterium]|nr:hypothetical protein [Verrucomicrobiota bacterium]HSA09374.1 hypothetical protein [Candidatus Paceibacterota bacterium]